MRAHRPLVVALVAAPGAGAARAKDAPAAAADAMRLSEAPVEPAALAGLGGAHGAPIRVPGSTHAPLHAEAHAFVVGVPGGR